MSLCVIMGLSGSGKSTLMKGLLAWDPKATILTSTTTRDPKPGDLSDPEGRFQEYRTVSAEQFADMERKGVFAWPVAPHGNRYGTPREILNDALSSKRLFVAALVWEAIEPLRTYADKIYPSAKISYIYLDLADSGELQKRLKKRGDPEEERKRRLTEKPWKEKVQDAGLPCLFLDAKRPPHELLSEAIKYLGR
jgi:guanylate kinase